MDGVKLRSPGLYKIRFKLVDPRTGKELDFQRRVPAKNEKEAYRLRLDMQRTEEAKLNGPVQQGPLRTSDALSAWLEEKQAKRGDDGLSLAPSTLLRYTTAVERTRAALGDVFVSKHTLKSLTEWRNQMRATYAAETVNGWLRCFREVLRANGNEAAAKVKDCPMIGMRIDEEQPNALTDQEAAQFIDAFGAYFSQYFAMVYCLFATGYRISTLRALRWTDLDFTAHTINAKRRLVTSANGDMLVEGTRIGRKVIGKPALTEDMIAVLNWHKAKLSSVQLQSGLVFPSESGGFRARSCLDKPFVAIRALLKIEKRFTPHGCRRTASALLNQTGGERIAMSTIGHLSVKMNRHYAWVSPEERLQAADQVATLLRVLPGGKSSGNLSGTETGNARKVSTKSA